MTGARDWPPSTSMYDAAREIGNQVRRVSDLDRAALERDDFRFNVNMLLGGQIKGQKHDLYMIYPQGNPLDATEDSPYLQIGEVKYGRPILDRGIAYERTSWRKPPSTPCCRWIRRCAPMSPSARPLTC